MGAIEADERELRSREQLGARPQAVHGRVAGHEPQERELRLAPLAPWACASREPWPAASDGHGRFPSRDVVIARATRAVVGDPAAGELDLAIDERGRQVAIVRDADSVRPLLVAQPDQRRGQLGAGALVETGERLVEHECARAGERARPRARRGAPPRRSARRRAAARSRSGRNRRRRATATRPAASRPTPRSPRPRPSGRRSCNRACWNATPTWPTTLLSGRPSMPRFALARLEQPGEDPRERRLARSVVADDEQRLAAVDAQVHVGERAVRPRRVAASTRARRRGG